MCRIAERARLVLIQTEWNANLHPTHHKHVYGIYVQLQHSPNVAEIRAARTARGKEDIGRSTLTSLSSERVLMKAICWARDWCWKANMSTQMIIIRRVDETHEVVVLSQFECTGSGSWSGRQEDNQRTGLIYLVFGDEPVVWPIIF